MILPFEAIHRGNLILVNAQYACRQPEPPHLTDVCTFPEHRLDCRAAVLLGELMAQIHGWDSIVPVSAWRSIEEQQQIWDDSVAENGIEFTEKFVAVPGHSEHQTGLAIDLALSQENIDFICPEFPYTGICQTFRDHAASYGFIERYPSGKEAVTGIGHEPWHFRYTGTPHALIMSENDMTLEEYTVFIKDYPHGKYPFHYHRHGLDVFVSYLAARPGQMTVTETCHEPYTISGNNTDGFIITEWRGIHV